MKTKDILIAIVITGFLGAVIAMSSTTTTPITTEPPIVTEPVKNCINWSAVQSSAADQLRFNEIVFLVMNGGADMPTRAIYDEFWALINKSGEICKEDIAQLRDHSLIAMECNKYFYQDALVAIRIGKSYKSSERANCEEKTLTVLLTPEKADARIAANEKAISEIATGQPVLQSATGQSIIFTKETIQATLDDMNAKIERVNKLFSFPSF